MKAATEILCASKCTMERRIGVVAFPLISAGFALSAWYFWL
ncbi:hypothetical protein [Salinibius halmophilus]|nr:hypothetical protein [Salinibius halmophilus]